MSNLKIIKNLYLLTKQTFLFLTGFLLSAPVLAEDGEIRIDETTFNEFSAAIGSIGFSDRYRFKVAGITICNSIYTATLRDLRFDIKPSTVDVTGQVSGVWCHIGFGGSGPELTASGNVYYDPVTDSVRFTFSSAKVDMKVHIDTFFWEGDVTVTTIDITSMLNTIPAVPIGKATISLNSNGDTNYVRMTPSNTSLVKHNGYIELISDVEFD